MTGSRRMVMGMILGGVALAAVAATVRADTPGDTDAEFFMALSYKQVAMMDDGYKAVALLSRGQFDLRDAAAARDYLVGSKIARSGWPATADAPLTKGRLAYMVCQALGIKGGVTMRLFGPSQRYCLAECQYLELMTGGAEYEHVTGGELVSVIDRADQYRQSKEQAAAPQPAAQPQPPAAPTAVNTPTETPKAPVTDAATAQPKATATTAAPKADLPAAADATAPAQPAAPAAGSPAANNENLPYMTPVEP